MTWSRVTPSTTNPIWEGVPSRLNQDPMIRSGGREVSRGLGKTQRPGGSARSMRGGAYPANNNTTRAH